KIHERGCLPEAVFYAKPEGEDCSGRVSTSMQMINTVGIISKPNIEHAGEIVRELLKWLDEHHVHYRCDEQTALYAGLEPQYSREDLPDGTQLIIVLGGDGTLLSAARV